MSTVLKSQRIRIMAQCFLLLTIALFPQWALAQFETATVLGTVRDESGGVLSGASVTLTNTATGISANTITDEYGNYQFLNVKIGTYRVEVEMPSFSKAVIDNVRVTVNARQRVDFSLKVGEVTEIVEVAASAASLVETDTSDRGQIINQKQIVELPLNGRAYADLALLSTGVRKSTQTTRDAAFNTNGQRNTFNNFLLDGVDNNAYGTSNQGFSSQVVQVSPDAAVEFKVQTNNNSAEFGRSAGAVVNVSMKSGTNELHATFYDFIRNTDLNAVGFFKPPQNQKPILQRNQFGLTLGGPVIRNRTFFFINYEGFRQRTGTLAFATIPTLDQQRGVVGAPIRHPVTGQVFSDGIVPENQITSFAKRVLAELPTPTSSGTANNLVTLRKTSDNSDKFDVKFDHQFNERMTGFLRVSHRKSNFFDPGAIPGPSGGDSNGFIRVLNQQLATGFTYSVTSASLLEVRLGISKIRAGKEPPQIGGPSMRALYGITGLSEDPQLTGGLTAQIIGGFTNLGRQATNPQYQHPFVTNPRINYSWITGKHSLKAGYEYQHINTEVQDVNPLYGRDTYNGQFSRPVGGTASAGTYNLADFMFGARSQYALVTFFVADIRQRMHFTYLQDDYKINPKLTLNIGLRYEYATPQYEARNRQTNFDPATNSIVQARDGSIAERALIQPDRNNFAPRIGLAYSPDSKTAVRAGYGISYVLFNRSGGANLIAINGPQVVLAVAEQNPTTPGFRLTQEGYPAGLTSPSNFDPLSSVMFHLIKDQRNGYVQSWFLSAQREILPRTLLDIAYVGSRGQKLLVFGDFNQARPLSPGETLQSSPLQARRPIPNFSAISTGYNMAFSTYNALQIKLERRAATGLYLLNSFTWSKSLDNATQALEDPNGNAANPQDIRNMAAEKGISPYDQPITNVTSAVWEVPFGKGYKYGASLNPVLNGILGGWQISVINNMWSGQPINLRWTPPSAFLPTAVLAPWQGGTSPRPDVSGNPVTPKAQRTIDNYLDRDTVILPTDPTRPFGNAGRNIARSHPFYELDLGIGKDFQLPREAMRLQFRAELFNALNKTNFQAANGNRSVPAFGTIRSTFDPRRIQFALKLYF